MTAPVVAEMNGAAEEKDAGKKFIYETKEEAKEAFKQLMKDKV